MKAGNYDGPVRVGQVRPSQLMHTFGIGGLVDLPHLSVIVNGIDDWDERHAVEITEERLLALVRQHKGLQSVSTLRRPPWIPETGNPFDDWARIGIPVSPFPRWLRCPWGSCRYLAPLDDGQFDPVVNVYRPDRTAYRHNNCKRRGKGAIAIPVRFLLACERGHLDEFPWIDFTHRRSPCDKPQLEMRERGEASGPVDVYIYCRNCQQQRTMREAFGAAAQRSLPKCRGRHPHLGQFDSDGCSASVRTLFLGASNTWFAAKESVLSIPSGNDPLPTLIDELWPQLEDITERAVFDYAIRTNTALARLQNYPNDDIWTAIEARRAGVDGDELPPPVDARGPEWHQFTHPAQAPDTEDFRITPEDPPDGFDAITDVIRADRLREVVAFTGFTRLSAPGESVDVQLAPISRRTAYWVPAVEVRGEGIFIRFDERQVANWEERYKDSDHYERLFSAHRNWRERRGYEDTRKGWPGARSILVHTFSHVLMRQLALDCGYSASSIRERIYSSTTGEPMAGVLLYTAAPDSEGTLGGLVSLADPDRLGRLLELGLEAARVCTSDPTCAEHIAGQLGDDHVHGAGCHACLFASETSCEVGNRYLDRSALVTTVAGSTAPFFAQAR